MGIEISNSVISNFVRSRCTGVRTFIKSIVVILLLVSALIIVPPRVWVKNKKAKLTYDGRISESLKLFHGSDGRVMFMLPEQDLSGIFVYAPERGLWRCGVGSFIGLKLIALSKRNTSGCADDGSGVQMQPFTAEPQSLQFALHDVPVVVSWQAAPR
ncbi:MAG: hypothetical protein JWO20_2685 [Candidatus Angelobacter sp.]|jgi:hypothetical protein|nr:hypothetical protein [Candidatus Angelobacter sp.]